jgi:hypothetical protein
VNPAAIVFLLAARAVNRQLVMVLRLGCSVTAAAVRARRDLYVSLARRAQFGAEA